MFHPGFNSGICQRGGNCMEPCSSNSFGRNNGFNYGIDQWEGNYMEPSTSNFIGRSANLEPSSYIKEETMESEVGKFNILINYQINFTHFSLLALSFYYNFEISNLQKHLHFCYIFINYFSPYVSELFPFLLTFIFLLFSPTIDNYPPFSFFSNGIGCALAE